MMNIMSREHFNWRSVCSCNNKKKADWWGQRSKFI